MRIAIVIPDEMVDQLDQLVPSRFSSAVDLSSAWGYDEANQRTDDIDSHRVRTERRPHSWDDLDR